MELVTLREFFFWCLVINAAIYMLSAVAWLALRRFYTGILTRSFRLDETRINVGVFRFLANFKLLITVFNFTPWLVLFMID